MRRKVDAPGSAWRIGQPLLLVRCMDREREAQKEEEGKAESQSPRRRCVSMTEYLRERDSARISNRRCGR